MRYVMVLVPNVNDARDVVQETATALWKASDKYDPAKPFIAWASRFALYEARRFLRMDRRRKRLIDEDVAALLESRRLEVSDSLDTRRSYLIDCLGRLKNDQRELIRGYYFEEESVETLAVRYGRGKEAIYKSLQRIRQALHACIEQKLLAGS